jgi:hypothetical protein
VPILLGFILGVIVTIGGAYVYDSQTGRLPNGLVSTSTGGQAPMVNWSVVNDDWQNFQATVRTKADDLERSLKRHTG